MNLQQLISDNREEVDDILDRYSHEILDHLDSYDMPPAVMMAVLQVAAQKLNHSVPDAERCDYAVMTDMLLHTRTTQ